MEVTELVELVERQRRLEELESNPAALSCPDYVEDMDKEMVNRMIGYLVEDNQRRKTDNESLCAQNKGLSEQRRQLEEMLSELRHLRRKESEYLRRITKLESQLSLSRNERYGDRRQRVRKGGDEEDGPGAVGSGQDPAGARGRGDGGGGELAAKTSGRAAVGRESEEERVYG